MYKKPTYYIVVPFEIRYDNSISEGAKLMFGEILTLSNKNGFCNASNGYFAKLYGRTPQAISKWINQLKKAGHVKCKEINHGRGVIERKIFINRKNLSTIIDRGIKDLSTDVEGVSTIIDPLSTIIEHNNTSKNNTSKNSTHDSAREETDSVFGKAKLTAEKVIEKEKDSAQKEKDFPVDDSHLTGLNGKTKWTVVAQNMAAFFEGPGKDQWEMMCNAAGGWVQPLAITTMWAGKNQDSDYVLTNWSNHTGKLTNWIKNELRSNRTHQAKIKSLDHGRNGSTASKELLSDETLEQAYRELIAEGYK